MAFSSPTQSAHLVLLSREKLANSLSSSDLTFEQMQCLMFEQMSGPSWARHYSPSTHAKAGVLFPQAQWWEHIMTNANRAVGCGTGRALLALSLLQPSQSCLREACAGEGRPLLELLCQSAPRPGRSVPWQLCLSHFTVFTGLSRSCTLLVARF